MIQTPGRKGQPALVALSRREIDVLFGVARAWRPAEIAEEFGLLTSTVEAYIWRLCQALTLRGKCELMIWVYQNPQALEGKLARAGLHPSGCLCGSMPCVVDALPDVAA